MRAAGRAGIIPALKLPGRDNRHTSRIETMSQEKEKKKATYVPLHPEIFKYDETFVKRFIDEALHDIKNKDPKSAVKEVAEQIYFFKLFTPEFCQLLIEEAEHCNKWTTNLEKTEEPHPYNSELIDVCEPDTTVEFEEMEGTNFLLLLYLTRQSKGWKKCMGKLSRIMCNHLWKRCGLLSSFKSGIAPR